jgi:beta-galactosidase
MKLGVCYYPEQWPEALWASDAQAMVDLGIRVVRIGEFAWSRMEPQPGTYDWSWLDRAVETIAAAGLQLVLGTPTAAPPNWLVERHPEILPVDAGGRRKGFGSRRHYCFSNDTFFEASRGIVTAMAQRYGRHPAVIAWQTDNEYGCNDTVLSYSPAALHRFRLWLAQRYGDVDTLNRAWGNVFWSMDYTRIDDIGFPVGLPAQVNPIHALDFRRFASDEVRRYNLMQVDVLRSHSPGRDVLHNFMGFFGDFEHHELAADLDVAAWDSYPLGFTDSVRFVGEAERLTYMRSGHPDIAAFHHDLYRGLCGSRWWVMEQQAGPVNWAHSNPAPLPGMVRTWTWEAFAHGAELVSYFRWRQLPYAQEQMHSGLNTPDNRRDVGGHEAAQVAHELKDVPVEPVAQAAVALVVDYSTKWMIDIQPQGADFDYYGLVFGYYRALRQLGLDVDIVSASAALVGYRLVVIPTLSVVDDGIVERLAASGAQVVVGPRTGAKTCDFGIPATLPPGSLATLMPMRVWRVEALRAGAVEAVFAEGRCIGEASRWRDLVEPGEGVAVEARFADDNPALLRHGALRYVAGWFEDALLRDVLRQAAGDAAVPVQDLAESVRLRRRGRLQFAVNYGPTAATAPAPADARFVLGGHNLLPADVAAWWCE